MGRTARAGLQFYRMDAGHITNPKVRLLFNEFGSDGYYIWSALLDYGYGKWGYYYDMNDDDELELFASEYCKKRGQAVREVITGCLRRGLFDKRVAELFGILTSTMMQDTFLVATSERRAKGYQITMQGDWLLLDFSKDIPRNIFIIPPKNQILPPNNSQPLNGPGASKSDEDRGEIHDPPNNRILPPKNSVIQPPNSFLPPNNTQNRVEKIRTEERREEQGADGLGAAAPTPVDLKEVFRDLEKNTKSVSLFIEQHRPGFIEPYVALWNIFAEEHKMPVIENITDARRKKFRTRIRETGFDFTKILDKARAAGEFLQSSGWFTWDWVTESEGNYLKVLEGNYDRTTIRRRPGVPAVTAADLDYLYRRFLEKGLKAKSVKIEHCNYLIENGLIHLEKRFYEAAAKIRASNLYGSNEAADRRMEMAYNAGTWSDDPDCESDRENLDFIAKKLAMKDYFQTGSRLGARSLEEIKNHFEINPDYVDTME